MMIFRFCEYDQSHVVDRPHELRLGADDAARTYAAGLAGCRPIEVWRGTRRIDCIPPRHVLARSYL